MAQGVVKLEVVENKLPAIIRLVPDVVARIVDAQCRETAADVYENIISYDAIDTSYMLTHVESHMTARYAGEVNSPAPYSAFVDRGTYKMAGRPFFGDAVNKAKGEYPRRFVDEFNKTL